MGDEPPIPLTEIRHRRRTEALRAALPYSPHWESWLESTGELAPEFEAIVPRPRIWSPVENLTGAGEWPERADGIRGRWRHWLLGDPLPPPDELDVDIMDERRATGAVERTLELSCGDAVRIRARLVMPDTGRAFPVVVVPATHAWWGAVAVRRGFAACVVDACDGADDSDGLVGAYPDLDTSRLSRRAWVLRRAVDALQDMPEIDPCAIVAVGHGRDAKAVTIAAAHDERIAAVAAISPGILTGVPARLFAERHGGGGIEGLTRRHPDWFHPRLRFFSGREHLLPTDANELLSLLAPRPVLLASAINDPVESTWALERVTDAVRPVYELLGAPAGTFALRWRAGAHQIAVDDFEAVLDWAGHAVGRTGTAPEPARRLHGRGRFSWPPPAAPNRAPFEAHELRELIAAALGAPPPLAPIPRTVGPVAPFATPVPGVTRHVVATADGVPVEVHIPAGAARSPLVLWLGPLARATGCAEASADGAAMTERLARAGWAVACFDPIGTGLRLGEEAGFARRHPHWSLLGRMVHDARAALVAAGRVEGVDGRAPWLAGYAAGAITALHVAALDRHVAGLAIVAPAMGDAGVLVADPMYGLADLLAAVDSRPGLVVSPEIDADAHAGETADAVRAAAGERAWVEHAVVRDHNRLSVDTRDLLVAWLGERRGRVAAAA